MRYEIDENKIKEGMHEMMKRKINQLDDLAKNHVQPDDKNFTKAILADMTKHFNRYKLLASEYIKTEEYEKSFQETMEKYNPK